MRNPDNPVHEELEQLPKETLIELIKMHSRNWHTCDGLWFSGVEERYGTGKALEIDVNIRRYSPFPIMVALTQCYGPLIL